MWEEYNKEQEEKREQEEEQMWEEYNKEQEQEEEERKKEAERIQKIDEQRNINKEEQEKREQKEKQIREEKEEFFNNKEKGYEDLLKNDAPYQALKANLMKRYTLPQLKKALNKKSLVEIYELYVKQVIKDLENTEIIEEGLTKEELDVKLQEKLDNEELKRTLSVRLELLKERQKEIKQRKVGKEQATKFFEEIEKKYGEDILPTVYLKDKTELIYKYAKGENTELLNSFKFLEYCEEQLTTLADRLKEPLVEDEEIDDYYDLQNKIKAIRKKALELGEIPPHIQEIKEKLESLCSKAEEGYKDLLPSLYYDFQEYRIKDRLFEHMNHPYDVDEFLEIYKEEYENVNIVDVLELCKKIDRQITGGEIYTKENGEVATDEEIYELRNAIQQIEKRKYIKENAYKETKIVVEPYNDRIMVYLKGEVKAREYPKLAELMEDGENLYKNDDRNLQGSVKGIEKGNFAVIAVLSKIETEKEEDYIKGYSWMFDKNPEAVSEIDSVVYDFSNGDGKIQSQKMIKKMEKYAKYAEKYGVAESIERKKGIMEKGINGIGSLIGKGKEKVLALGEGIRDFHPIGNAIENRRANRYAKDLEVDGSKATNTYNKWEDQQNKAYQKFRQELSRGSLTPEEQNAFIQKLKDEKVFEDRSNEENDVPKKRKYGMFDSIINMGR